MKLFKNIEEFELRIDIIDLKKNIAYTRRTLKYNEIPYHVQRDLIGLQTSHRHQLREAISKVAKYN